MSSNANLLIACLGGRNLAFPDFEPNEDNQKSGTNKSLREVTKEAWEQLEREERPLADFELRIIKPLLEEHRNGIDDVRLIASNQEKPRDGDTIYSAKIIQHLIEHEYGIRTRIEEQTFNITDNDEQLQFARRLLAKELEQNPDKGLMILDSGGTPQQKSALKLAAEFMHPAPEDGLHVFSAYQDDNEPSGSGLKPESQTQYRKVLKSLQTESLIQQGLYEAALGRLPEEEQNKPVAKALRFMQSRHDGDPNLENEDDAPPQIKESPLWDVPPGDAKQKNPLGLHEGSLPEMLMLYEKADFYRRMERYGMFVLSLHQFIEKLMDAVGKTHVYGMPECQAYIQAKSKRKNDYYENYGFHEKFSNNPEAQEWFDLLKDRIPELKKLSEAFNQKDPKNPLRMDDACLLLVGKAYGNDALQRLCAEIEPYFKRELLDKHPQSNEHREALGVNSKSDLSKTRNTIAHEGKNITREELEERMPGLLERSANWREALGLPENNYFARANKQLLTWLRKG